VGIATRNAKVDVAITDTTTSEPKKRVELLITNTSPGTQTIWYSLGTPAEVGKGFPLAPLAVYSPPEKSITDLQINAIADAASATMSIMERSVR